MTSDTTGKYGMEISVKELVAKIGFLRIIGCPSCIEGRGDSSVKLASTGSPEEIEVGIGYGV